MKEPCMCGDLYCKVCGPLQGNYPCGECGKMQCNCYPEPEDDETIDRETPERPPKAVEEDRCEEESQVAASLGQPTH